jgi:drug/metabolite transporter (DMT)-like permease
VIAVGVLVALAAAVANAFAVVLQAAEDRRSPESEAGRLSLFAALVHRRRWLAGTGLMVVAWPLQILALALAPITVVQPMLATTQLVLLGVAGVTLRERVGALELFGVLTIVAGVALVVAAAPHHSVKDPDALRVAVPLSVVGIAAVVAYVLGRVRPERRLSLVIGAGLAYAWVDFVNKLLASDISTGHWGLAVIWLLTTLLFGALAFLEETTALQRRPAVTVAPVVGSIQDPLPVIMALAAGVEVWGSSSHRVLPLACGLALVTVGGALLGRSKAVARVSGEERASGAGRRRLAAYARGEQARRAPDKAAAHSAGAATPR